MADKLPGTRAVHLSLAAWPGLTPEQAMAKSVTLSAAGMLTEPLWGALSLEHVQLVPQSQGILTCERAQALRQAYPGTRFRLHANVRVGAEYIAYDLSTFPAHQALFAVAARIQQALGASGYSAHAGSRACATLNQVFDSAKRCAELFGRPVAIEGLYPDRHGKNLLSSWEDYARLLEVSLPFALDLSHLNIVAARSRRREFGLVQELAASEHCLEIHVSANDGRADTHQVCGNEEPWWLPVLENANPDAVIFSEGNLRRHTSSGELPEGS